MFFYIPKYGRKVASGKCSVCIKYAREAASDKFSVLFLV